MSTRAKRTAADIARADKKARLDDGQQTPPVESQPSATEVIPSRHVEDHIAEGQSSKDASQAAGGANENNAEKDSAGNSTPPPVVDDSSPEKVTPSGADAVPHKDVTDEPIVDLPTATAAVEKTTKPTTPARRGRALGGKPSAVKTVTMKEGRTRPMIVRHLRPVHIKDLLLTDAERDFFTEDILERVVPILNFKDVKTNRFAVGTIPLGIDWGTDNQGAGMDRYIVDGKDRVTVWFFGIVATTWLCPREGSRINIGLKLLSQRDHDTARHLQYDLSVPAGDPSTAGDTVFCSRFLSTRADEGGAFEDVYDAQDRLLPWSQMHSINPAHIQKTDLVLVECYIKRFKPRERSSRKGWTTWGVNFDILRIAYVCAGPGVAGDVVPDDCDVDL